MSRGVNLIGLFTSQSGLGELSRKMASMLSQTSIPYVCLDIFFPYNLYDGEMPQLSTAPIYPINIICFNHTLTGNIIGIYGGDIFINRYNIGVWAWETEKFPAIEDDYLKVYHEVWGISEFCANAIAKSVPLPVRSVRFPMVPHEGTPIDIPKKFTVLFVFSLLSVMERKNPLAVIEAFTKAFGDDDTVQLVLKVNGDDIVKDHAAIVRTAIDGKHNIIYITDNLSCDQKWGLINQCDVYMSLHRSEGLGLSPLEAMAVGKPVVATGYSANMEYMNDDNSIPIPYEMVDVPDGTPWYAGYGLWAKANTDSAAMWLRRLRDDPDLRSRIGNKAKEDVSKYWSVEYCKEILVGTINDAYTRYTSML